MLDFRQHSFHFHFALFYIQFKKLLMYITASIYIVCFLLTENHSFGLFFYIINTVSALAETFKVSVNQKPY